MIVLLYSNKLLYLKTGGGAKIDAEPDINIKMKFYIGVSNNQIAYSMANET